MHNVEWLSQRGSFILLWRQECAGEGDCEDANSGHSRKFFEKQTQTGDQTLKTEDKTQRVSWETELESFYCCELQEQKGATSTINCSTEKFRKTLTKYHRLPLPLAQCSQKQFLSLSGDMSLELRMDGVTCKSEFLNHSAQYNHKRRLV